MGLDIINLDGEAGPGLLVADRELYSDASKSKLLEAGDPDAAYLVVSHAGKVIPPDVVEALRLVVDAKGRVMQKNSKAAAAPKKERPAPKDKQRKDEAAKK